MFEIFTLAVWAGPARVYLNALYGISIGVEKKFTRMYLILRTFVYLILAVFLILICVGRKPTLNVRSLVVRSTWP